MKYKLLLSLFVVSVLACSGAEAKEFSGDLDYMEEYLNGKTKQEVKKYLGGPPSAVTGPERQTWIYKWTFIDEVSEHAYKSLYIVFIKKKSSGAGWVADKVQFIEPVTPKP